MPHAGERRRGHLAQHRDDRAQRLARRGRAAAGGRGGVWGPAPGRRGRGCRRSRRSSPRPRARSPRSRRAASTSEIGACDTATVGASSRISSGSRGGRADRLRQQRGILAADERRGHPDPQLPVPARHVVDEVGESLRHRRFGVPLRRGRAVRPRVRPVSRARRIDGSLIRYTMAAPADSTVGHRRQLLGEIAFQRSGHDDGQVGLQQEVVDGLRAAPRHRVDGARHRSASSLRPGRVIAPRPTMPSACASVSRSPTGCGCSRTAQRGRRQIIARDASAASTPAPSGRSASTLNSNLRSSGAAVE